MGGLFGLFDIGRLGLLAQQVAIQVTGQNIANVNTPGYSRQVATFQETLPLDGQPGQIGSGVQVTEVKRVFDQFVEAQITVEKFNNGRLSIEESVLGRVEILFNDAQGSGINQALIDFFASLQDLSTNPQGQAERIALLETAQTLVQRVRSTDSQLQQIRRDLNSEIQEVMTTVNSLASQIADLNAKISKAELTGQNANDLRDQRGILLNELGEKIDFQSFEDSQGKVTILIAGGKPLVESFNAYTLQGISNSDNLGFLDIGFSTGTASTTNITSEITSGELKGLLNLRDTFLPGYIDQLDQLAAGIVNEINQQHRVGFGLDSSTGNSFFSPLSTTVSALSTNTGTGSVAATIATPSSLTLDPYRVSFSGGNYTIQNLTLGTSTTAAYADPTVVAFEGIQFTLSGAPANGDIFNVSAHQGSAGTMVVAVTNPNQVAAASTLAGLPGDNGNALLLAQLENQSISALGNVSLQGFYGSFTATVGSDSQSAKINLEAQDLILRQLTNQRESISGVSLDEEMANLIKFQRAYEASAQFLGVIDELLLTVLSIRR